MSAKKFLEALEKSGLLEQSVLADLRRKVAENKRVTAEAMAKALVDKGHLTKFQATKLVGEAAGDEEEEEPAKPAKSAAAPAKSNDDDLLGLAPLDDEEEAPAEPVKPAPAKSPPASAPPTKAPVAKSKGAPAAKRDDPKREEEVVMLEDAEGLTPVEDAGAGLTPLGPAGGGLTPIPGPTGGLTPLGPDGGSSDPFDTGGAGGADPFGSGLDSAAAAGSGQLYVPKTKKQRWDTHLILGGGLALLLCFLLGGIMLWSLLATPAIEMYEAAEKSYRDANYADSRDRFEQFLERYGDDENASKARVRVYLIRIRLDMADPQRALDTAKEVLPEVIKEKDADMAREEFPGLLPSIPEGFIARARQAKDTKEREELVGKAKEAMELVNDPEILPTSRRTAILPQLQRINESIALIERAIAQDKNLVAAIQEIDKAEQAGDTTKAFQVYNELLRNYPAVRDDARLKEAVEKVSVRERSLVKVVDEPLQPSGDAEPRTSEFRVVLASRTGGGEAKPQNPVAAILAGGSIYGLDSGNGQMLWSRFVGYQTRLQPVRVSSQSDSDVLVSDSNRHDLLRIKARTGEIAWRLPVGEQFAEPVVSGPRIYVATVGGRLLEIDLETGASSRHVKIPQRLTVSPAAASDQPYIFQPGEHSHIYVLNATSLACEDVIYLGHQAGTIEVPPLMLLGHLFVAENITPTNARVNLLKVRTSGEGPKLFPTQDALRTNGRLIVPMVVYNRRLLFVTDRGEIRVFDVDKTKDENSVTDTGKLTSTLNEPIAGYPLAEGQTLWIADNKLTKYMVQVTRKEITRDPAITSIGDTFVAPLQLFGSTLVHTRRIQGSTGITVAGINVDNPRQVLWQTHLGVPAGRIAVNPTTNEILAISSGAALYQINQEVLRSGYNDTPLVMAGGTTALSFTTPIEFENEVVAFFNPADNRQLLVYNPALESSRLRIVTLQLGEAQVPCCPTAFQGALLAPVTDGRVLLLKLLDGSNQVLPFQPKLEPGDTISWRRPAVLAGGKEFVIADDRKNVYRVGIKDQPSPHLAEVASNRLDVELASGLGAAGDTAYGFVRTNGGDAVVAISTDELKSVKEWDLGGGRVTWGPEQVGEMVMFVIDEKQLRIFGPGQKELWETPATMHGQPAGRPLVDGGDYVFASVSGTVWRLAGASGQEMAKAEVGEPLGAGPVAFRGRLLLCGNDGALHVVPMPTGGSSG